MVAELADGYLVGDQVPRIMWVPLDDLDYKLADDCIAWARDVLHVELDAWEKLVLRHMLASRGDRWACFEFGLLVSRQNGKSMIFVIRCLFALIELRQKRVVYSAHRGDTAREQYQLAYALLEESDIRHWQPFSSAGREAIELRNHNVLKFKTRSKVGGRGLGGDTLVLDEAQELDDDQFSAISPILAARTMVGRPQMVYGGSAGNRKSTVWARLRRRGLAGGDDRLGYMEWSIDSDRFLEADPADQRRIASSLRSLAEANPSMGIVRNDGTGGIAPDYLLGQQRAMDPIGFAREFLGVGEWPEDEAGDWVIPRLAWQDAADTTRAAPSGRLVLAFDVTPDRVWAAVAVVGGSDGVAYGGLVEPRGYMRGTEWVIERVREFKLAHRPIAIICDPNGPAGSLIAPLEGGGIELHKVTASESAQACGGLYDAAISGRFKHRAQPALDAALARATRRQYADRWVWDRRSDVAALIALTLAHWGFLRFGGFAPPPDIF